MDVALDAAEPLERVVLTVAGQPLAEQTLSPPRATGTVTFDAVDLSRYLNTERRVTLSARGEGGEAPLTSEPVAVVVEDRLGLIAELREFGGEDFMLRGERGESIAVRTRVPVTGVDSVAQGLAFLDRFGPLWNVHDAANQAYLTHIRTDASGAEHLTFALQHEGLPVWGLRVDMQLEDGAVTHAMGDRFPSLPDRPDGLISQREVALEIERQLPAGGIYAAPRLGVLDERLLGHDTGRVEHAWRVGVTLRRSDETPQQFATVYVDAESGALRGAIPVSNSAKDFEVWDAAGSPWAPWIACFEPTQDAAVFVENFVGALTDAANTIYNFLGGDGELINDAQLQAAIANQVCDTGSCDSGAPQAARDARQGSHTTYDYFQATFGRDAMDGGGGEVESIVGVNRPDWDPFGTSNIYNGVCNRLEFVDATVPLDLFAHEYAHGVTRFSTSPFLMPIGEPGILNEHLSDAYAVLVESEQLTPGDDMAFDWEVTTIRDMANPAAPNGVGNDQPENAERYRTCVPGSGQDDAPFCIQGSPLDDAAVRECIAENWFFWEIGTCAFDDLSDYLNARDFGGIHYFNGIPNKAVALIGAGGPHEAYDPAIRAPDETAVEIELTGIGRARLAQLLHATVTHRLRPRMLLADYAQAMVWQAEDFVDAGEHGFTAEHACTVRNAFAAVGLLDFDSDCDGVLDGGEGDSDDDGVSDGVDTCPQIPNPSQLDVDGDGVGAACDEDADGDGVLDEDDNCTYTDAEPWQIDRDATSNPQLADNPNQVDNNANGIGDACEDRDLDGVLADGDGDGVFGNAPCASQQTQGCDDNCPETTNPNQLDADGDGLGDACDDSDDDGVFDDEDACPDICNPDQRDTDSDGTADCASTDDDGDTVPDDVDLCPRNAAVAQTAAGEGDTGDGSEVTCLGDGADGDADGDSLTNCEEIEGDTDPELADTDGDGFADACDTCPLLPADEAVEFPGPARASAYDQSCLRDVTFPDSHRDLDGDGLGNGCDPDLDGDGTPNAEDDCPNQDNHQGYVASTGPGGETCEPITSPAIPIGPDGVPPWEVADLTGRDLAQPIDLTPCGMGSGGAHSGTCPDWQREGTTLDATVQSDAPFSMFVINDRGEVVVDSRLGEATEDPESGRYEASVSFEPEADAAFRLGDGTMFRNTRYRLFLVPDPAGYGETQSTVYDLSMDSSAPGQPEP